MMLLARSLNNRDELRSSGGSSGRTGGLGASGSTSLLGSGSTESESWRRGPVLPGLTRPVPHHLGVDGAADTVGELGIQLGQLVAGVHAGIRDVPHGGGLHDVPDHELLDGLVLGAGLGAVGASNELHVPTAVLVAASIPPLGGHVLLSCRSESSNIS